MADDDESSLSDHGARDGSSVEMRPAPAINNQRQWAVSQESRGQDNYFENQATKTNVAYLASAGEIHFVLHYSQDLQGQDRPTQRQGENNCIQKNQ